MILSKASRATNVHGCGRGMHVAGTVKNQRPITKKVDDRTSMPN